MRIHGHKANLVLDESDEITNPSSARTKAVLSCFRRCRAKLLTTGTSTRNNIVEFAPQLELLYNNSFNMISWVPYIYSTERDGDMTTKSNPYYGAPIPAYRKGYALFSASHLPEKITVFGVGQWTQDIYNAEVLRDILDKTVITRSFREIVGREIRRLHQVPISFTEAERAVCKKAIEEFNQLRANYFATTGNSRKRRDDAADSANYAPTSDQRCAQYADRVHGRSARKAEKNHRNDCTMGSGDRRGRCAPCGNSERLRGCNPKSHAGAPLVSGNRRDDKLCQTACAAKNARESKKTESCFAHSRAFQALSTSSL